VPSCRPLHRKGEIAIGGDGGGQGDILAIEVAGEGELPAQFGGEGGAFDAGAEEKFSAAGVAARPSTRPALPLAEIAVELPELSGKVRALFEIATGLSRGFLLARVGTSIWLGYSADLGFEATEESMCGAPTSQ
jgi:hypothetical protein